MLTLILLTFIVFVILWFGDAYLTKQVVDKVGPKAELNPLLKKIIGVRGHYLWIFKSIEIALFLYLIYYMTTFAGSMPFYVLLGYILFYGLLVSNNSWVYYKVTGKASRAFSVLFVLLLLVSISFIYLNYVLYDDLTFSYSSLKECNSQYRELHRECKSNETMQSFDQELEQRLRHLNLNLRKT